MAKNLYDRRWQLRRVQQLRLHPLCCICLRMRGAVVPATIADHVTPHNGDPELFRGPIQSMCKQCHDSWKQQLERTGRIKGCDLNGYPLDPNHHWNRK